MSSQCSAILSVKPVMQEDVILGIVHDTVEFVFCPKTVRRYSRDESKRGWWNGKAWYCSEAHMNLPRPAEAAERHHCTDRCGYRCATPTCLNAVEEGRLVCAACREAYEQHVISWLFADGPAPVAR